MILPQNPSSLALVKSKMFLWKMLDKISKFNIREEILEMQIF